MCPSDMPFSEPVLIVQIFRVFTIVKFEFLCVKETLLELCVCGFQFLVVSERIFRFTRLGRLFHKSLFFTITDSDAFFTMFKSSLYWFILKVELFKVLAQFDLFVLLLFAILFAVPLLS